jgi:hypothetical protein
MAVAFNAVGGNANVVAIGVGPDHPPSVKGMLHALSPTQATHVLSVGLAMDARWLYTAPSHCHARLGGCPESLYAVPSHQLWELSG